MTERKVELEINHTVRLPSDEYVFIKPAVRVSSTLKPDQDFDEAYAELREIGAKLWLQELMHQLKEAMGLSEAESISDFIEQYAEALGIDE